MEASSKRPVNPEDFPSQGPSDVEGPPLVPPAFPLEMLPPPSDRERAEVKPELTVEEDEFVKHAMEKLPEAVLPHVVSAAENDQPLEAVYERRHEVKDEATVTPMVPIGNVISNMPITPTPKKAKPVTKPILIKPLPDVAPQAIHQTFTYKRAMLAGFGSGIVIIVVAVAIYAFK